MTAHLETLKQIIDPDVGVNIVDLGLVESITEQDGRVHVALLMTTPACPQSGFMKDEVRRLIPGASVEVLDHPLWHPTRMSADAKAQLGWS
ncbi:MAG: metal-sulfur cluster assembly factor [Magnetospirillum gryphiswaldense]|nr:metal-sulfur cluster assembly factor [Magnetospirillum gryphiswaldense]